MERLRKSRAVSASSQPRDWLEKLQLARQSPILMVFPGLLR
jgi:hypothetical protein